ncbi:MAG: lytic transglycosylase domain-containing protein [Verrucomicrobia bacterium]|nr:lytic transglycosylase domain-containing protein [Verrucomicrobiota bacterium]
MVWIAEVESSWNPRAESHAGAVGLFQLMPDTALRFGLDISGKSYDERIHPYKSATAAAQYLKILYEQFDSWYLALAAYNAGEGRVQQLLDEYHATKYYEIAGVLPEETQRYVPRVMAIVAQRRHRI